MIHNNINNNNDDDLAKKLLDNISTTLFIDQLQIKHSVNISGHQTSYTLEDVFYNLLKKIARDNNLKVSKIIERIDENREEIGLSSAIRIFILHTITQN